MLKTNKIVGQEFAKGWINNAIANLNNKKGSIIAISGETAMGKSTLLNFYYEELMNHPQIRPIYVENQAPIGGFKIGSLQPLYSFSRVIQQLFDKKNVTAEKKFAVNVGMTALASLPLIGDVFYAVKEIGRDWRQYKRDKSSDVLENVNSAVADYFDSICAFADKQPLVLLIDDMHWSDPQSIELLSLLTENIHNTQIVIIVTYKQSIIENQATSLLGYFNKYQNSINLQNTGLESFNHDNVRSLSKLLIRDYKANSEFEEWIMKRTYGIPGMVSEYLNFFNINSPFKSDGSLIDNFENSNFVPENYQSIFSTSIENLDEDEKNLLAICSAEGREFTAYVVSDLLNTDIITTIKRLKNLQTKTGIIKSTGARQRYGVMTTVYEFSQAFYQSFFENSLEYEESVSIHGQIASLLKSKFDSTNNNSLRTELAPYLAAHSIQSGDEETARKMLLETARFAEETGSGEIINEAFNQFKYLNSDNSKNEDLSPDMIAFKGLLTDKSQNVNAQHLNIENNETDKSNYPVDFNFIRRSIVEDYHNDLYSKAADLAISYLNTHEKTLKPSDQIQLLSLASKCFIELDDFQSASRYLNQADNILKNYNEPTSECLLLNTQAVLLVAQGRISEASELMKLAAKKAVQLPSELQLLTLSNITLIMDKMKDTKSDKFVNAIRKLSKRLNFEEFEMDVLNELNRTNSN